MSAPATHSPEEEHRRRALQRYEKYFVYPKGLQIKLGQWLNLNELKSTNIKSSH